MVIASMVKKFKSILLIDDCAEDRFLTKRILEKDAMNVSEARGWKEAIEKLENHDIEMIILDLVMPEMDGIGVLKLIREKLKDVPVVIYTGSTKLSEKECVKKGSDAMVSKYCHLRYF
jgi:CheY-like chemotaxis protein